MVPGWPPKSISTAGIVAPAATAVRTPASLAVLRLLSPVERRTPAGSSAGGVPMKVSEDQFRAIWQSAAHDHPIGHWHFWDRALSRRQFLGTAAAAGGVAAAASLWGPGLAHAAARGAGTPRPIPGTVAPGAPFPVKLPGAGSA